MRFTLAVALGVFFSFVLGWGNATATETSRLCDKFGKMTCENFEKEARSGASERYWLED